jgi:hypothetical protein
MKTLKKHYEIFKINRLISGLNRELLSSEPQDSPFAIGSYIGGGIGGYRGYNRSFPQSEKSFLIRQSINTLVDQREAIR